MSLLEKVVAKIAQRDADLAREADAGDIIEEYVIPCLPATIDRFEAEEPVALGEYGKPTRQAKEIWLTFTPKKMETEADFAVAYGTIVKVAAGLRAHGWEVNDVPDIAPHSYAKEKLTIVLTADRTIPGKQRWFRRAGILPYRKQEPDRAMPLKITFDSMPETDVCRIVESVESVPATTRTVRKVVCDGDGPAGLIPAVAIPAKVEAPA